jgi:hypothetical protein
MRGSPGFAWLWLAGIAGTLLAAAPARAYEDQASLGLSLGYTNAVSERLPAHGAIASLEASLGLDDIWTVRVALGFAHHPDSAPMSTFLGSAELLYLVDVFELVPYFGLGVDGLGSLRRDVFGVDFAAHPVFGLDWLPERNLVFGLALRPIFLVTALDRDPVYFTFSVSGSLLFDL